jgi:hypothetical protein
MRYIVTVANIFAADRADGSPTWRMMKYPSPAVLHAVRYIHPQYPQNTLPKLVQPPRVVSCECG